MFLKLYSPIKIEIKIEMIGENKYKLFYSETLPDDCPQDALNNSVSILLKTGMFSDIKLRGRKISYTKEGGRNIFNGVASELLGASDLGVMTLTELIVFAGAALVQGRKALNEMVKCPEGKECPGAVCPKAEKCETLQRAMDATREEFEKSE